MRFDRLGLVTVALAVLAAAALIGVTSVASAAPVPKIEKARIHAILSPYDFFPASLPKPLIFISWKETDLSPTVCGTSVTIQFAAAGDRQINWSSSRDCDHRGQVRCSAGGYPAYSFGLAYNVRRTTINRRHVFFSHGNHGSNAWACIPLKVGGLRDWAVVGIWESNFISPTQAMRLVAYARH